MTKNRKSRYDKDQLENDLEDGVESVNTGSATITNQAEAGSVKSPKHKFDTITETSFVESFNATGGNSVLLSQFDSFTETGPSRKLIIDLRWYDGSTQQDLFMRMNGDGGTTGNYRYTDESGTETTGSDQIPIITESNNFGRGMFRIVVTRAYEQVMDLAVSNVRTDRMTVAVRRGTRDVNETLDSVELIPSAGTDAELEGVVYERYIG